jgi:hypothetical protein
MSERPRFTIVTRGIWPLRYYVTYCEHHGSRQRMQMSWRRRDAELYIQQSLAYWDAFDALVFVEASQTGARPVPPPAPAAPR